MVCYAYCTTKTNRVHASTSESKSTPQNSFWPPLLLFITSFSDGEKSSSPNIYLLICSIYIYPFSEWLMLTPMRNKFSIYLTCVQFMFSSIAIKMLFSKSKQVVLFFPIPFSLVMLFICNTGKFICYNSYSILSSPHFLVVVVSLS